MIEEEWKPPTGPPPSLRESRFDKLWFGVTWLSVPLMIGYLVWRFLLS